MKTIIVGGVAAGASTATRLRRLDETAEIILLEKGPYTSFANCGLPYYIGGEIKTQGALLVTPNEAFRARFNIDVRVLQEAVKLDTAAKTITIKKLDDDSTYEESYDNLVLALGAIPFIPPMEGLDLPGVFKLKDIPDAAAVVKHMDDEFPDSAVVCGGGFIGLELAENLKNQGLDVTVIDAADHIMPPMDTEMSLFVKKALEDKGVKIQLNCCVKGIEDNGSGLTVNCGDTSFDTDMVFLSIGVRPDTAWLKDSGVELNQRGAIITDDRMRTSAEGVYAAGDAVIVKDFVTGNDAYVPLAGPANRQGRIIADNLAGIPSTYKNTQGSSILKVFDYTAASTGICERTAKAAGIDYGKVYLPRGNHAGYYPGAVDIYMKVIFDKKDGRILGAQLFGKEGTDKRCDVLATAIRCGLNADQLTELELCYAPSYGSAKDPVNYIGYAIQNVLNGLVKLVYVDEIDELKKQGNANFIDVRPGADPNVGILDGFDWIPLGELRKRADEIDKTKPVYVCCKTGLNSYNGCRVLSALGFDCYNVSGGAQFYFATVAYS